MTSDFTPLKPILKGSDSGGVGGLVALMAAQALIEKLPFPLKDLDWSKLPEVARATGFGFESTRDLLQLVMGGPPPDDVEAMLNLQFSFEFVVVCSLV